MNKILNALDVLKEHGFVHADKVKKGVFELVEHEKEEYFRSIGGGDHQFVKTYSYSSLFRCSIDRKEYIFKAGVDGGNQINSKNVLIIIEQLNEVFINKLKTKLNKNLKQKDVKEKVKKI